MCSTWEYKTISTQAKLRGLGQYKDVEFLPQHHLKHYFIMKKLTKLNLHGAQLMNDAEMKRILGGNGDPIPGYLCSFETLGQPCTLDGIEGVCRAAGTAVFYCETMPGF